MGLLFREYADGFHFVLCQNWKSMVSQFYRRLSYCNVPFVLPLHENRS